MAGIWQVYFSKRIIMSQIKKPTKPSEIPQPDKDPEIKPDIPEKPVMPEEDPEIEPEEEPEEPSPPSPPEIPAPSKNG